MAAFPIKSQLPDKTQKEIDRVNAIDSTLRNATEADANWRRISVGSVY